MILSVNVNSPKNIYLIISAIILPFSAPAKQQNGHIEKVVLSSLKQNDKARLSSDEVIQLTGNKITKFPELKVIFSSKIDLAGVNLKGKKIGFDVYYSKGGQQFIIDSWPDIYLEYFVTKKGKLIPPSEYSFSGDLNQLHSIGYAIYLSRTNSKTDKTTNIGEFSRGQYDLCLLDEELVLRLDSIESLPTLRVDRLYEYRISNSKVKAVLGCNAN